MSGECVSEEEDKNYIKVGIRPFQKNLNSLLTMQGRHSERLTW